MDSARAGKRQQATVDSAASVCVPALCAYRLARALPERPSPFERVALIHSDKRDALVHSGLYDEVKAVLLAAEAQVLSRRAGNSARVRGIPRLPCIGAMLRDRGKRHSGRGSSLPDLHRADWS
jgi:hypothetical protein